MMESLVAIWVVLSLAYLLQPLLADDVGGGEWDHPSWFVDSEDGADDSASSEPGQTGRVLTDGGRVCQNCGASLKGDFTYCGECVTPLV